MILLRVSGIAELSRTDPKMNDDGEGDDIWVELLPVQLVDAHRAGFLGRKKKGMTLLYKHLATRQPSFNHLLPAWDINNPRHKGHLSQECNEMRPRFCL